MVAYGQNKNGTLAAAACEDNNVYLYDAINGEVKKIGTHNTTSNNLVFIKNNQLLIADSEKSAGLYTLTGEKLKTFAAAQKITNVEASYDGETVILGQADGSMHFYSTDNSKEMGFVPSLNSTGLKSMSVNKETSKMLATYKDGSVFYVRITDALFSPSTVAPPIKNFPIAYNALTAEEDETTKVQEFAIREIDETEDINTEFIASTRELKDTQKFEINEKKEKGESVIIKKDQQDKSFEYTDGFDSDITLQKKYPNLEDHTYIQEFNQDLSGVGINRITPQREVEIIQEDKGRVTEFPPITVPYGNMYGNNSNGTYGTGSGAGGFGGQGGQGQGIGIGSGGGAGGNGTGAGGAGSGSGAGGGAGFGDGTGGTGGGAGGQPIVVIVNGAGSGEPELSPEELKALAAAEKKAQKEAEKAERAAQKEAEKAEKALKKAAEKKEKELKERKAPEEIEDLKTLFKDGHGAMANVGLHWLQDPYFMEVSLPLGYRNYDLIRPFYFGGTIEPYFAFPDKDFPYVYSVGGEKIKSPSLIGTRIYVPAGFCIYPLRNSLEIYTEMGLGMSLNQIWNKKLGSTRINTKIYPGFYGNLKVGAAWDFINLSLCANYDALLGISFGAEFGAIVNIGGSRTIGSLKFKQ